MQTTFYCFHCFGIFVIKTATGNGNKNIHKTTNSDIFSWNVIVLFICTP